MAGLGRSINRFYENRNHDIHTNGELTLLKKLSTFSPRVIIDGGANVGGYSLAIHRACPDARILAFEPVPATFDQLTAATRHIPQIQQVMKGFFKENTTQQINLFSSSTHASIYDIQGLSYASTDSVEIELVRGDDFLAQEGIGEIDFLKLDLEGADFDALQGFKQAISGGRIRMVQFEYGYINITTKTLLLDFYRFFEAHGYQVGKIFPKKVSFRPYAFKYEDFIGPNFVAVKKDDLALIQLLSSPM